MTDPVIDCLELMLYVEQPASLAIAKSGITAPEGRRALAQLRRHGCLRLLAPGLFAVIHPLGRACYAQFGRDFPNPPTWQIAYVACRHRGWTMGLPHEVARFMLGLGERPQAPQSFPSNGTVAFPKLGIRLVAVRPALLCLTPAGQALVFGLPSDASEAGLRAIGEQAAGGTIMRVAALQDWLRQDVAAGLLGAKETIVANAILERLATAPSRAAARRAPREFEPPMPQVPVVRLEGWSVFEPWGNGCECLCARQVFGHPYIADGDRFPRSSPLQWLDESLGYAKAESRLYRLGTKLAGRLR